MAINNYVVFIGEKKKSNNYWTKEKLQDEANKYETRGNFWKFSPSAASITSTKKWMDELFKNHINKGYSTHRPNLSVIPDEEVDFRNMPYEDKSFKLVVFDPPHIFGNEKSNLIKYYGSLDKENWRQDIKKGFDECWRVLEDYGVLIFKWNEVRIKKKEVLELIEKQPLFGHRVGSRNQTHWLCFMKAIEQRRIYENN